MATRLESFPASAGKRSGPAPKYPWDQWLDGSVWQLIPGEDFTCRPQTLASAFWRNAERRGLAVTTQKQADGSLVVQASSP